MEIINVTITSTTPDFKTIQGVCKIVNKNWETFRDVAVTAIRTLIGDNEFTIIGCPCQKKKTHLPDDVIKANDELWQMLMGKLDNIWFDFYWPKMQSIFNEFNSIFNDERITLRKIIQGNTFALGTAMKMGHTKEILVGLNKIQAHLEETIKKYDELLNSGKHIVNMAKIYSLNIQIVQGATNG